MKNNVIFETSKVRKRITKYLDNEIRYNDVKDLVPSYVDILLALYVNDGKMRMNEISECVGKDKSTITVLVNRLEERGYVKKVKSDLDKRVTNISPTDKGLDVQKTVMRFSKDINNIAFKGFNAKEKKEFFSYLRKIQENFNDKI